MHHPPAKTLKKEMEKHPREKTTYSLLQRYILVTATEKEGGGCFLSEGGERRPASSLFDLMQRDRPCRGGKKDRRPPSPSGEEGGKRAVALKKHGKKRSTSLISSKGEENGCPLENSADLRGPARRMKEELIWPFFHTPHGREEGERERMHHSLLPQGNKKHKGRTSSGTTPLSLQGKEKKGERPLCLSPSGEKKGGQAAASSIFTLRKSTDAFYLDCREETGKGRKTRIPRIEGERRKKRRDPCLF